MSNDRMPAAFIGHGSPMNTLEANGFTRAWHAFGEVATPFAEGRTLGSLAMTIPVVGMERPPGITAGAGEQSTCSAVPRRRSSAGT